MSYTVFARKYRPQTFADLLGQEHIGRTLAQAIVHDRVAHAFLFTGVRGVGKTSSARILAKALNCLDTTSPEPCNACDPCSEITAGRDTDVLEIDGASHNSVDDVRNLQQTLPYRPKRDRYRIIIVDEVHMLSSGAFNAFLKTLEEPPAHVKFIFATTEIHKVPATIRSRCQRFDFRLIGEPAIQKQLEHVLSKESIQSDSDSLRLIAREAAGSMRDALTLLDQLVAHCPDGLTIDQTRRLLGLAEDMQVTQGIQAVLLRDAQEVFRVVGQVCEQGVDLTHFTKDFASLLRDLTCLRIVRDANGKEGTFNTLGLSEESLHALAQCLEDVSLLELQRAFWGVSNLIDQVAQSVAPRIVLEMGLVRLASSAELRPLSEALAQLQALKSGSLTLEPQAPAAPLRLENTGHTSAQPGNAVVSPSAGPTQTDDRGRPGNRAQEPAEQKPAEQKPAERTPEPAENMSNTVKRAPASVERTPKPVVAERDALTTPSASALSTSASELSTNAVQLSQLSSAPAAKNRSVAHLREDFSRGGKPENDLSERHCLTTPEAGKGPSSHANTQDGSTAYPAVGEQATPQKHARTHADLEQVWLEVIGKLHTHRPALAAVLEHGHVASLEGERLTLCFAKGSFFGQQANDPANKAEVVATVKEVMGRPLDIAVIYADADHLAPTPAAKRKKDAEESRAQKKHRAENHPHVQHARDVFPEAGAGEVHIESEPE